MTTAGKAYVIMAGGLGSRMGRVGDGLNKALLPLQHRAILTHLIELGPQDAEIVISAGHRAQQLMDYLHMAHPDLVSLVTWVDAAGVGPGGGLLACREVVGDRDMVFTSCDTLWEPDKTLWHDAGSWAAYAPVPAGTGPERWCRLAVHNDGPVGAVVDKKSGWLTATQAYTGLAMIKRADLPTFWDGVRNDDGVNGEQQVSGGLAALAKHGRLHGRRIAWTDTGDEDAYRRAVIARDGYDWSKSRQATWVLPSTGRVVKWWANPETAPMVHARRERLAEPHHYGGVPEVLHVNNSMLTMRYIHGISGYAAMRTTHDLADFIDSPAMARVIEHVEVPLGNREASCRYFHLEKTTERIKSLRPGIRWLAEGIMDRLDTGRVVTGCIPSIWHGDLNLGNVIRDDDLNWWLIDWRPDFAGGVSWGDYRHDLGKLIGGMRVRWDWAQRGHFAPWPLGRDLERSLRDLVDIPPGTDEIGILALISSAPLHEPPLDEVLITRAAEWVSDIS